MFLRQTIVVIYMTVIGRRAGETRGVTDPFGREVEDWIDRLEREFIEVEPERSSGTGEGRALKGGSGRRAARPLRPARDPREPAGGSTRSYTTRGSSSGLRSR